MPSPTDGLTFGDFTAEEWEKFFIHPAAQLGNSPPVEFLFEFEYSDNEEPDDHNASSSTQMVDGKCSSAARNVTTGPEDSGVEVGQESEQEITSLEPAKQSSITNSEEQSKAAVAIKELPQGELSKDIKESTVLGQKLKTPQQIVFAGGSVIEETDTAVTSKSTSTTASPESNSFPPLPSAGVSHADKPGDKPENERLRKRRKRRKQRKRSGSVSSSSSECSDKERNPPSNVGTKSKGGGLLLATEKEVVEDDSSSLLQEDQKGAGSNNPRDIEGKDSSSTEETSNSPTQSDSDLKSPVNDVPSTSKEFEETQSVVLVGQSEQITKPSSTEKEESAVKKVTQKPSSWADLFKNTPKPSAGIVIKVGSPAVKTEAKSMVCSKKVEEVQQTKVGVHEDIHAKRLAESIQNTELNYQQRAFIPRGLINKGNWCYVNATLQALTGCSPFFNLMRELPLIKDRGSTSTPILDSLTTFMSEFKITKLGMQSKTEFIPGESWEPTYVYKMLSVIQSTLSMKGHQEDAQEFLSCMLNGLHEELLQLSKIVSSPTKEQQNEAELQPETLDSFIHTEEKQEGEEEDGDWEQVGPRNKSMVTRVASYPQSLISNIFGGYLRSSVHQTGLKDSANVEPFFELHLDVQLVTSIEEALKNLVLREDVQGYTCTKTKAQVEISRRVTLEELPRVLILHLKRFIYSKSGSQKLHKVIDYPVDLTIGKELLSPNVRSKYPAAQKCYKLFAVLYHHGKSSSGGHYTADVHHPIHGWIRTDDTRLKVVPTNHVLKPTQGKDPYVLFYRRTDLMP